jgi:hypothetical protein
MPYCCDNGANSHSNIYLFSDLTTPSSQLPNMCEMPRGGVILKAI